MQPKLFPVWLEENLHPIWFGKWMEENGTFVGAITAGLIGGAAAYFYAKGIKLDPTTKWIKAHPIPSTLIATLGASVSMLLLNKYATFVSASVATAGILVALHNNRLVQDKEKRQSERQEEAARAALVHQLDAICKYCSDAIAGIRDVRIDRPNTIIDNLNLKYADAPLQAVSALSDVIKLVDDRSIARRCSEVANHIQLVKAAYDRIQIPNTTVSIRDIDLIILKTVILHALSSSLLHFARNDPILLGDFNWQQVANSNDIFYLRSLSYALTYKEFADTFSADPLRLFWET